LRNKDTSELSRAVRLTIPFLRMAAIELRRIADASFDIADQLRHIADKLVAEADDLQRLSQTNDE
jgi:hypothetical protein